MIIVFTIPIHLKVRVQSIIDSPHQIFPASLNSSPRVYSCVLITWREWPSQRRRRNKPFQCQTSVGIFSSSNKPYQTQVESRIRCRTDQYTGEDHFLVSKKPMCLRPRKWDCCSDLFAKNAATLTKSNTFASVTEWQDSGEHGCWLKVSSPACMLPIFAKAPCCLELFGCCCRRLRNMAWVRLIPLRHCWRDAFFCVCVGSESFVTIGRRTAQFCFGLLMRCLFLGFPPFAP